MPAKRKTAKKRKPARKKKAVKRKPARKKKAVKRKPARKKKAVKRKPARKKKAVKRKPAKKKKATKRKPAKKKKSKKKRKLNPALMKTLVASDKLAAVVGAKKITRQKAIKFFWAYVKRRNLQDSKDRRNINLDDTLKKLFGNKKQVNMFEATKVISKNLK